MMRRTEFWLAVLLLWLGFVARAHKVTALPPFNDESLHIRRAEAAWTLDRFPETLQAGKTLTYYWTGAFRPERLDAIWLGRSVTGLFALLGLAAAYAVARRLFGQRAGLLALLLVAFAPFSVFFDRLLFADPLAAALGMLLLAFSLRMLAAPQVRWGMVLGLLGALAFFAKLIAAPLILLPFWAVAVMGHPGGKGAGTAQKAPQGMNLAAILSRLRAYRRPLLHLLLSFAACLLPYALYIAYRELSGQRVVLVDPVLVNSGSPLETIRDNLRELLRINWRFHSPYLFLLGLGAITAALRWRTRAALLLLGAVALPWGTVILLSGRLSTRYLQLGLLPLLVLLAGGLLLLAAPVLAALRKRNAAFKGAGWALPLLLLLPWLLGWALPFIVSAWDDPLALSLPPRERYEYFQNFTAGYGLMDAAAALPSLERSVVTGRVPVQGIVGSCHQVRLYLDEGGIVDLQCSELDWQQHSMEAISATVQARYQQEGLLYLLVEPALEFSDLSALPIDHSVIARYPRPFDGMSVEIWRVNALREP